MKRYTKEDIRKKFEKTHNARHPVLVTTAGIGLSAKYEEMGETDMICVSYFSILGMDGHSPLAGYLPYGNANEVTERVIRRIASQVKKTPLMAAVCCTDPTTDMEPYLEKLLFLKTAAVCNLPSVGGLPRDVREVLQREGIYYQKEIEILKKAKEKGLYTAGVVFNDEQAAMMAETGTDMIICSQGYAWDRSEEKEREMSIVRFSRMIRLVKTKNPDAEILLDGDWLNSPEEAENYLNETGATGLFLSSVVERLPIEEPLVRAATAFKMIAIEKGGQKNGETV